MKDNNIPAPVGSSDERVKLPLAREQLKFLFEENFIFASGLGVARLRI
jgi:hypothetical protein